MAAKHTAVAIPSLEVGGAPVTPLFPTDAAMSREQMLARIEALGGTGKIVAVDDYVGGGVTEKENLIGVPFVVTGWKEIPSKRFGTDFVVVNITLLTDGSSTVFTDGGQGINNVLMDFENDHHTRYGLLCPRGLRASSYEANEVRPAGTTYYFA